MLLSNAPQHTAGASDVNIPTVVTRVHQVEHCFAQHTAGASDVNIPRVVARVRKVRLCFAQHTADIDIDMLCSISQNVQTNKSSLVRESVYARTTKPFHFQRVGSTCPVFHCLTRTRDPRLTLDRGTIEKRNTHSTASALEPCANALGAPPATSAPQRLLKTNTQQTETELALGGFLWTIGMMTQDTRSIDTDKTAEVRTQGDEMSRRNPGSRESWSNISTTFI
jgi:hypothetical protein